MSVIPREPLPCISEVHGVVVKAKPDPSLRCADESGRMAIVHFGVDSPGTFCCTANMHAAHFRMIGTGTGMITIPVWVSVRV